MVTIDNHVAVRDPKHPESSMCWRCHLPASHAIHGPVTTGSTEPVSIKGTATPKKLG